jgi:predicted kinase
MLIIFGGRPGTGKTTLSRALAQQLGAVHVRIDTIEQAIAEWSGSPPDDGGYRVAYAVAEDNLRLGRIVIADSVNPVDLTRDAWRAVADRAGVPSVEVEIICSDGDAHRSRVEFRNADPHQSGRLSWRDILARDYHPWTREHIVIDTAGCSVERSVAQLTSALAGCMNAGGK